jgi:uncharacterized protein YndB with AHSA1/START domain
MFTDCQGVAGLARGEGGKGRRWQGERGQPDTTVAFFTRKHETQGGYRVVFGPDAEHSMAFFGKYLEVVPNARVVWTGEESPDAAVTTVTFAETAGKTQVTLHERYPKKEALDASIGGMDSMPEQLG